MKSLLGAFKSHRLTAEDEAIARFGNGLFSQQRINDFLLGIARSKGKNKLRYGKGRRAKTSWGGHGG